MIIDFKQVEETVMKNFKGGKGEVIGRMFFDGTNRIMLAKVEKGSSIGYHKHETNSEIIYVLEGVATMNIEGVTEYVKAGEVHYCKKDLSHGLLNEQDETLKILCVVPEQ